MISPNRPEPSPKPGQIDVWPEFFLFFQQATAAGAYRPQILFGADVVQAFLDDCYERNKQGIAKYGTPLQTGNGRDCDRDLYQELMDAVAYSYQGVLESNAHGVPADNRIKILQHLINLALAVRAGLQ